MSVDKPAITYNESSYELTITGLFEDKLGYRHVYGPDVIRPDDECRNPLFEEDFTQSLIDINPGLPMEAIAQATSKITSIEGDGLLAKNRTFMNWLQNGLTVTYKPAGSHETRNALVQLIDYENPRSNRFTIINQWTVLEDDLIHSKKPDVVVFVNGLPLVVMELKSPVREETDASEAYLQLRNGMDKIPVLYQFNAFIVMSDMSVSKAGTLTADEDRFMEWKTTDGQVEDHRAVSYDTFFEGIFEKSRLLDILRNFICFSGEAKIMAAYHQYFAVRKAIESTKAAIETKSGKGGVFWHTQGSGKSLSMVFYAHLLQTTLNSPTIVVITDRNDLDDQLYKQFAHCQEFLRQTPEQASSRADLKTLLDGRTANGIIFSTIQKFEETNEPLSERANIIVMADEAHRSQYGLEEQIDPDSGKKSHGDAWNVRQALPNATYLGFTGTPISSKDRSTIEVFGDYIDIYDMTQAVADGSTRPVYYESRVVNLKLNDETLSLIDAEYDRLAEFAESYAIDRSKRELSRVESILGADSTIAALCEDIVSHYENGREHLLTGKAMIVAYSRPIAIKIYHELLRLRPAWTNRLGLVMTDSNKDPEEWHQLIGNKAHRDEMARRFKDDADPFKIAIVVDMWLTGFDVPSLATMYVYKPMAGHNLMQAIARVNRVYEDPSTGEQKQGGLVVDYVGLASALRRAMSDYTQRDRAQFGDPDITKTAYPKFVEKLEVCRSLLHGFDYSDFLNPAATDSRRSQLISDGVNLLAAAGPEAEQRKENFIKEVKLLTDAKSLCRSLINETDWSESVYFEAVRTVLTRLTPSAKPLSFRAINDRISELLKESISSQGVINLFSNAGADDDEGGLSLFDPQFLAGIASMKQKNLAVEMLRRLLAEQVAKYSHTNATAADKFSELLANAMKAYLNGLITNEEVIEELLKLAKQINSDAKEAEALGLTAEEKAFYDAIVSPTGIRDFYADKPNQLIALTHELADMLRHSRTVDWRLKDSARARMRRMVKKLLKKYDYPPAGEESAREAVIHQCELFADSD